MSQTHKSAQSILDDAVCGGVAIDVFHADQARRLLEAIDLYVEQINETGVGKHFFANLQIILERDLCLSISRLYESHSARYPSRSIAAAVDLIDSRASELRIVDRRYLLDALRSRGASTERLAEQSDEQLSRFLSSHLQTGLPKPNSSSAHPLDQALASLKRVRDKAIAHRERVDAASLIVPAWEKLAELIDIGRSFVVLIARSYLNVRHDLEYDAGVASSSLRRLLKSAGLLPSIRDEDAV